MADVGRVAGSTGEVGMTRAMVLRLFDGRYIGVDYVPTDRTHAAKFSVEDIARFGALMRPIDRSDPLHGVSFEMLPKRHGHVPMSAEEATKFRVAFKMTRLLWEADKYDRYAEGYKSQAAHAEKMAQDMRERAAALRATVIKQTA